MAVTIEFEHTSPVSLITREQLNVLSQKAKFIRHGKTRWNEEGRLQGGTDNTPDTDLLETELVKMALIGTAIRQENPHTDFLIASSSMRRAVQTAQAIDSVIKSSSPIYELDSIREYPFGQWEGLLIKTLTSDPSYHEAHENIWIPNPVSATDSGIPPQAEPFMSFLTRVNEGLIQLAEFAEQRPTLVVTHAMTLRAMMFLNKLVQKHNLTTLDKNIIVPFGGEFFFQTNATGEKSFIKPTNGLQPTDIFKQR